MIGATLVIGSFVLAVTNYKGYPDCDGAPKGMMFRWFDFSAWADEHMPRWLMLIGLPLWLLIEWWEMRRD